MIYDNREDTQLVDAIKHGDSRAFDCLMMRYQSRVYKVVSRFVKDPHECLDVCQEVFMKAYRALDRFREESSFYTWLYRIATNTAKNYVMAENRHLPQIRGEAEEVEQFLARNAVKEFSTPEHILMRNEIETVVYHAIDRLPAELKTAIMLRELDGLSYEAISDKMHCPVGTIRSRIFRARVAIDKSIDPLLKQ